MEFGELERLRAKVRDLLRDLQALPGFAERRAELLEPPGAFREVPWRVVLAQVDGETGDTALATRPHDLTPEEDAYAEAVLSFAESFVFGAEWSARAVHFALQQRRPIGLPPGPPGPWYRTDRPLRVDLQAGEPIPAYLREEIVAFVDQLVRLSPAEPRSTETTKALLQEQARRSPTMGRHVEAVEEYEQQFIAPPGSRSRTPSFETNAQHALAAIESRLAGIPVSPAQRQGLRRLRRHLNAAVNGEYDAPVPFEPTDARGRTVIRRRERTALAASTASARIRRARRRSAGA